MLYLDRFALDDDVLDVCTVFRNLPTELHQTLQNHCQDNHNYPFYVDLHHPCHLLSVQAFLHGLHSRRSSPKFDGCLTPKSNLPLSGNIRGFRCPKWILCTLAFSGSQKCSPRIWVGSSDLDGRRCLRQPNSSTPFQCTGGWYQTQHDFSVAFAVALALPWLLLRFLRDTASGWLQTDMDQTWPS